MKLRKLLAITTALALTFSLSTTAFASAISGSTQGGGTVEGIVEPDADVFSVDLPTSTKFNFILDPQGLISSTDAEAYYDIGLDADDFYGDTGLYFANHTYTTQGGQTTATVTSYSNNSDTLTITNKGNVPVTVDLSASLTGYGTIGVVNSTSVFTTTPQIYMALQGGSVTGGTFSPSGSPVAIATQGTNAYTATLYTDENIGVPAHTGAPSYDYVNGQYVTVYPDNDVVSYYSLNFQVTGAVNKTADWTGQSLASASPSLSIVWAIDPPADYAPPSPGVSRNTISVSSATAVTVNYTLGSGDDAATDITAVNWNGGPLAASNYSIDRSAKTITFAAAFTGLVADGTIDGVTWGNTVTIVFDNNDQAVITFVKA